MGGTIIDYARDPGGRIVLGNGVKSGVFGALGTFIGSGFSWVAHTATGAAGAVVSTVSKAAGAVSDAVVNTGKAIVNKAAEYGGGLIDSVSQTGSSILNTAKQGYEIGREFISITIDDAIAAKNAAVGLANDAVQLGKDLVNPEIMIHTVGQSIGDIIHGVDDVWNHPEIIWNTVTGSAETGVEMGKTVLNGIWQTVTDPKKAYEFIKEGMTKKAQKALQVTVDEMGLKAHLRQTSIYSPQRRVHGNCLPKPAPLKMKSLDYIDNFLGGPPHSEGVVGLYKPKMPPKDVMRSLHPKTQKEIVKRFKQQSRAYRKYANNMPDGFEVRNGVVYKKGTRIRYTSDNDIMDITDLEGRPVSRCVENDFIDRANQRGADFVHRHHMDADWKTAGGGECKAKMGIINKAREGQEGLNTFSPHSRPTHSHMEGRQIRFKQKQHPWGGEHAHVTK